MAKNKVILVTGGSSGIGYEAARQLATMGHKVYAAARRTELMEPLRQDGVTPLNLDVTDTASIQACINHILDKEGRIDVLVNNAGYGYFGAIECVSDTEARRQMDVNVFGLAAMCRMVLPTMRKQHSGRIVNIASIAGRAVFSFGGWYNVSKYSVEALSDALRIELQPFGIKVCIIEPGCIKTDWGLIAADHLDHCSKNTDYEEIAHREADAMRWVYTGSFLTKPERIAKAITKAATASCPRTRYRLGSLSGTTMVMHALLPARCWDALVRRIMSIKIRVK